MGTAGLLPRSKISSRSGHSVRPSGETLTILHPTVFNALPSWDLTLWEIPVDRTAILC